MKRSTNAHRRPVLVGCSTAAAGRHGAGAGARGCTAGTQHRDFCKAKVEEHVDDALDAAKATPGSAPRSTPRSTTSSPPSRTATRTTRPTSRRRSRCSRPTDSIRRRRRAARRARGRRRRRPATRCVQAVYDAHDALTAPQRQALDRVRLARDRPPDERGCTATAERGAAFMKHMVDEPDRRGARRGEGHPARSGRRSTRRATGSSRHSRHAHEDPAARIEQVLDLFAADSLDEVKVDALRAEHEERAKRARR